jgi:hypothetical protein
MIIGALLCSLSIFPIAVYGSRPEDASRSGIAGYGPQVTTFALVVVGSIAAFRLLGVRPNARNAYVPLVAYVALLTFSIWSGSSEQWAGVEHFLIGALAWGVGTRVASVIHDHEQWHAFLLWWIAAVSVIQLIVVVGQLLGMSWFPQDATSELAEGYRANGTFTHPAVLGKLLVLLMIPVLPATQSPQLSTRRVAWLVLALMAPSFILTSSRTNTLAFILTLVVWTLLLPLARNWARKIVIPALIFVGILATSDIWRERFQRGEDGSFRSHMNGVALAQLERDPLFGVGANSYVTAVSRFDVATGADNGWPVHNVFLLVSVELGLIGALLFFVPMVILHVRAFLARHAVGLAGQYSRSILASAPGVVAICMTGWGMMLFTMPLWLLLYGLAYELIYRSLTVRQNASADEPNLRGRAPKGQRRDGDRSAATVGDPRLGYEPRS